MAVVQSDGRIVSAEQPFTLGGIAPQSTGITFYDSLTRAYETIYRTQPNVRLVVAFLARNVAQLNLRPFERLSKSQRVELDDHELAEVLEEPFPRRQTRYDWTNALVSDIGIFDRHYSLKVRNRSSGRLRLVRIPPQKMRPIGDNWLFPEAFELLGNKDRPVFPWEEVLHFHGYNPEDARDGLPPIETIRRVLAEDQAAGEWREQFWRKGARAAGFIERPETAPHWSKTARERFREQFRSDFSGQGEWAGGTPVLEDGMKWKQASFTAEEAQYLEARKLTREEVAAFYFIPPPMVGLLDRATFSNIEEQHRILYQDTLGPLLRFLEARVKLQLIPEFGDLADRKVFVEFNIEEKMRGNFEQQIKSTQAAVGGPFLTRDEGRALFNREPLPDGAGEQIITPLNVTLGGRASPQDTRRPEEADPDQALDARPGGAKALEDLVAPIQGLAGKHQEILEDFFARQRDVVLSKLGAGQGIDEVFDELRWTDELTDDLLGIGLVTAAETAGEVIEELGPEDGSVEFDEGRAMPWLEVTSSQFASEVNAATFAALSEAVTGVSARARATGGAKQEGEELEEQSPTEAAGEVFATAIGVRAGQLAVSRTTMVANFGRHEAARDVGVGEKEWRQHSGDDRHADIDGERVELGATFSNGGRWPGDAGLPIQERANCTCSLELVP